MSRAKICDVAVVGAGVFGAWTALHLARRGKRVLLLDAYGPGHSRSSSGDESRIIRMGYGADEIYTQWSMRSLAQWKELFAATRNEALFKKTGVVWMAEAGSAELSATKEVLKRNGVAFNEWGREELSKRYPQINIDGIANGIYEPESGVLMARRAVAAVGAEAQRLGAEYRLAEVLAPNGTGKTPRLKTTNSGEPFYANQFIFACGAGLAQPFSQVLGKIDFPTLPNVFYNGCPAPGSQFVFPVHAH